MCVDKQPIPWVDHFNYLGVVFNRPTCGALAVDTSFIKRKFYASLQWHSQDLHMEGVGRAKRDRHGRRPCWGWVREGVTLLPEGGSGGITPEKILEI
jgi:hypothetical protein